MNDPIINLKFEVECPSPYHNVNERESSQIFVWNSIYLKSPNAIPFRLFRTTHIAWIFDIPEVVQNSSAIKFMAR